MRKLGTMLSIAGKFTRRHSPEILTGIGVAGMFTAIGLAIPSRVCTSMSGMATLLPCTRTA